jgi:hypothetical protein
MTKLDELLSAAAGLPDSDLETLVGLAKRLRVTMAPAGDERLEAETSAWLDGSAADMAASLAAVEADLPPGHADQWLSTLMANATPVRFDPETGEVVEVAA